VSLSLRSELGKGSDQSIAALADEVPSEEEKAKR